MFCRTVFSWSDSLYRRKCTWSLPEWSVGCFWFVRWSCFWESKREMVSMCSNHVAYICFATASEWKSLLGSPPKINKFPNDFLLWITRGDARCSFLYSLKRSLELLISVKHTKMTFQLYILCFLKIHNHSKVWVLRFFIAFERKSCMLIKAVFVW